ncbi:hypothetical protein ILUMI_26552, partial [Ignelater luminosus]
QSMVTIFWDHQGFVLIKYIPKNTTITADTYCEILKMLRKVINKETPSSQSSQSSKSQTRSRRLQFF